MLVYFTSLYFLSICIWIYKRRGIDISLCIVGIYLLTSICSIIIYNTDVEYINKEPTLIPTIVYCSMVTLVVYPFYKFNSNKIRKISTIKPIVFNILSWTLIIGFLFSFFLFKDDIMFRLAMGDQIGELRGQLGDLSTAQATLTGPLRIISSVFMTILSMSAVSFILFFYSISFLNKKWYFNLMLLLSSCGCILAGIVGIDRSITFYWIINFIFIYILMKPYLSKKSKLVSKILGSILLSFAFIYLLILTYSRFNRNVTDSMLNYLGQNYLNFCWFWDNYNAPVINWGFFFPISTHFLGIDWGCPVNAVSFGWFVESKVGYFVNLFYTFMGSVMLYLGQWAVIPFCLLYFFITKNLLNDKIIGVYTFIKIFILAVVPYCGVILYLYVDYIRLLGALVLLFFCYFLKKGTRTNYKFVN